MLVQWACVLVATAVRIGVCLGSTTWTSSPRQKAQPANSRGQCWAPVMILWGQWGHVDYIGPLTIWGGGRWRQRFVLTKIDTFFSFPIQNGSASSTICGMSWFHDFLSWYPEQVASHQGSHLKAREMGSRYWISPVLSHTPSSENNWPSRLVEWLSQVIITALPVG